MTALKKSIQLEVEAPDVIDLSAQENAFQTFHLAKPFHHCVVENFIKEPFLNEIEKEFLSFDSPKWFVYNNAIEDKKALNDWNVFPPQTYKLFSYMNSPEFVAELSDLVGVQLYADSGLHGGGWHVHGTGGNLNPHLDYSIHPKLGLERKINIIIYLSRELKEEHGGHLGLWNQHPNNHDMPDTLAKEIAPVYNRAVIFDTTQNSWHGMSRPLTQPQGIYRKSLAIYYLCEPSRHADSRGRALFAPREDQIGDKSVEELIRMRVDVSNSSKVYRKPHAKK